MQPRATEAGACLPRPRPEKPRKIADQAMLIVGRWRPVSRLCRRGRIDQPLYAPDRWAPRLRAAGPEAPATGWRTGCEHVAADLLSKQSCLLASWLRTYHSAAPVLPAGRADPVWHHRCGAVGAGDHVRCCDLVVLCSAHVALATGLASLGDGHGVTPCLAAGDWRAPRVAPAVDPRASPSWAKPCPQGRAER